MRSIPAAGACVGAGLRLALTGIGSVSYTHLDVYKRQSWDLVAQLAARPEFGMSAEEIRAELEPARYIGRCPEQAAAMTSACRALIGADAQQAEELTL